MDTPQLPEWFSISDGETDGDEETALAAMDGFPMMILDPADMALGTMSIDTLYSDSCVWNNVQVYGRECMCHDNFARGSRLISGICIDDYETVEHYPRGRPVGCSDPWKPSAIRAIQSESIFDPDEPNYIIIDSGSDVTIVPSNFAECGIPIQVHGELRDCQGTSINTDGARQFDFELTTTAGKEVILKERGFLSNAVSSPIISYGHLFKHGWCIDSEYGRPLLRHRDSGIGIAMTFRHDSLVVEGAIRQSQIPFQQVATVNVREHPEADIPRSWREAKDGWQRTSLNHPMRRSNGFYFIDPVERFLATDFPYRTTLAYDGTAWHVVELCAKMFDLEDRALPMGAMGAVTLLTPKILSPEQMGFLVHAVVHHSPSAQASDEPQRQPASVEIDIEDRPVDQRPDVELVPAANIQVVPDRTNLTVDGVHLTASSTTALLRTACGYCGISRSGSKQKLFKKLLEFYDRRQLEISQEVAAHTAESVCVAKIQVAAERPEDPKLIAAHEVNHTPYAAWCEACVGAKARPDAHFTNRAKRPEREVS